MTSSDAVREVIAGANGLVSAAGHVSGSPGNLLAGLAEHAISAIGDRPIRFVTLLGAAVSWPGDLPPTFGQRLMHVAMTLIAGRMLRDAQAHADRLRASELDFVVVRPPRLTDGPPTGNIASGSHLPMGPGHAIRRSDLASFLLDQLESDVYVRQAPMVHGISR